jgi:hypothetical protein
VGMQPHFQQAGPKIPSSLNVFEKVALSSLSVLSGLWNNIQHINAHCVLNCIMSSRVR